MDIEKFVREHYFFELNRKQDSFDSLRVYLPTLGLVIGFLSFFATWVIDTGGILNWGILIFDLIFSISLIFILLFATIGKDYEAIPTPKEVLDHKKELERHYLSSNELLKRQEIDKEIKLNLIEAYANSTHRNTIVNDYKYQLYYWANRCILLIFFLFLISSVSYLVQFEKDERKPEEIKIIGIEGIIEESISSVVKDPIKIDLIDPVITHCPENEKDVKNSVAIKIVGIDGLNDKLKKVGKILVEFQILDAKSNQKECGKNDVVEDKKINEKK